jgi:hypothetical protein
VRFRNSRAVSAFKASGMPNLPTSTHAMHANDRTGPHRAIEDSPSFITRVKMSPRFT